ncbi:MAG: dihydrofolate reductase family protein [Actinomycetota bacterium]
MRKLIVQEFLSLDGVMQAPGGPDEDRSGGFEHGGWQLDYVDEILGEHVAKGFEAAGGFVLGRKTYDTFAAYWPTASDEVGAVRDPINKLPKYVVSRTLTEPLEWANSSLIIGDVADGIRALKEQDGGDLVLIGSGNLVQTLIAAGLVDEYRLMIYPILLGSGTRLFRDGNEKRPLTLIDSITTSTGVVTATYRPADQQRTD